MKINVGCGDFKVHGLVNVDKRPECSPDVCDDGIAYIGKQPDGSIDEIYAGHFIEHLKYPVLHEFMDLCKRKLKASGKLIITVPDVEKAVGMYNVAMLTPGWVDQVIYGDRSIPEQHHWTFWNETRLRELATLYGFDLQLVNSHPYMTAKVAWQSCGIFSLRNKG